MISPLAKVPQLVVKCEKFIPAVRKSRIGGPTGLRICRYHFLLIPSASQGTILLLHPPHDYVATMTVIVDRGRSIKNNVASNGSHHYTVE